MSVASTDSPACHPVDTARAPACPSGALSGPKTEYSTTGRSHLTIAEDGRRPIALGAGPRSRNLRGGPDRRARPSPPGWIRRRRWTREGLPGGRSTANTASRAGIVTTSHESLLPGPAVTNRVSLYEMIIRPATPPRNPSAGDAGRQAFRGPNQLDHSREGARPADSAPRAGVGSCSSPGTSAPRPEPTVGPLGSSHHEVTERGEWAPEIGSIARVAVAPRHSSASRLENRLHRPVSSAAGRNSISSDRVYSVGLRARNRQNATGWWSLPTHCSRRAPRRKNPDLRPR